MINIYSDHKAPEKWFAFPQSSDEQYLLRYIPANSISPDDPQKPDDALIFNAKVLQRGLVDWKGVLGEDNQPLPCTEQTRLAFLREPSGATEDRLKWIFETVFVREKFSEADGILKNSPAPSPGASTSPRPRPAAA